MGKCSGFQSISEVMKSLFTKKSGLKPGPGTHSRLTLLLLSIHNFLQSQVNCMWPGRFEKPESLDLKRLHFQPWLGWVLYGSSNNSHSQPPCREELWFPSDRGNWGLPLAPGRMLVKSPAEAGSPDLDLRSTGQCFLHYAVPTHWGQVLTVC